MNSSENPNDRVPNPDGLLKVAVAITGEVFYHPLDGSKEARAIHKAAIARGAYPYTHLMEGDSVTKIIAGMRAAVGQDFGESHWWHLSWLRNSFLVVKYPHLFSNKVKHHE